LSQVGLDLDLLAGKGIPSHVRSPRRSHSDEHPANFPERQAFTPHNAGAYDLEQVFQDLLYFLSTRAGGSHPGQRGQP
jgi:hypothetical protein